MKEFKEVKVLMSRGFVEYGKRDKNKLYTLEELESMILLSEKSMDYVKMLCMYYNDQLSYCDNIVWLETMILPYILSNPNNAIHLDKPYYWEKGDYIQFDFYPVANERCLDKNGCLRRILGYSIKFNCDKY